MPCGSEPVEWIMLGVHYMKIVNMWSMFWFVLFFKGWIRTAFLLLIKTSCIFDTLLVRTQSDQPEKALNNQLIPIRSTELNWDSLQYYFNDFWGPRDILRNVYLHDTAHSPNVCLITMAFFLQHLGSNVVGCTTHCPEKIIVKTCEIINFIYGCCWTNTVTRQGTIWR